MTMSTGSTLDRMRRRLRVPAFTAATVSLGVGAHLAAGGEAPSGSLLVLLTAVVAVICSATAGRELRLAALLGAVALAELGIHVALLGDGHAAHGPGSHAPGQHPALMTAAHLVASALLACWLRRGEAAVWRTVGRTVRLVGLARRGGPVLPPVPLTRGIVGDLTRPLLPQHAGTVRQVRGPPVAV